MYRRRSFVRYAWQARRFRAAGLGDAKTAAARDQMLAAVAGRSHREMAVLVPETMGSIMGHIYPQMHELIMEFEDAGIPTYLCSASPVEIVEVLATVLGMSGGAIATRAHLDADGRYTGELAGPWCHGEGKAAAIALEAKRSDIDLAASWAYSDSESDLPMLELVGTPVAVNPDARLRSVARERCWEILRFEPRRATRAAVGAGVVTGATAAAVASAMWVTRRPRP